jgi:ABC-type enterobactin transport system permease subunit
MDWYPILIIAHIVGTVLGVGGATFAELNVIRALRDGRVSRDEKGLMHGGYAVLRLGFFILLVSGFGLLVYYRLNGMEEMLYEPKLWAKLTIVGLIGINAVLLQLRVVPLLWGSAISLTSWYAALIIGSLHEIEYSYFVLLAMYAAAVVIVHVALRKLHRRFTKLS